MNAGPVRVHNAKGGQGFSGLPFRDTDRDPPLVQMNEFEELLASVRACRACAGLLPVDPRPVVQVSPTARLIVASQAPGSKVHASGVPFSDASGDRLREWMGVTDKEFYDAAKVAILPMGFCYPGKASGGDAPPRPECAELWRDGLLAQMPQARLTLLVGSHAQNHVLGRGRMLDRVRDYGDFLPGYFPLPHPSWRSTIWMRHNPWFVADVLPVLRDAVRRALEGSWI